MDVGAILGVLKASWAESWGILGDLGGLLGRFGDLGSLLGRSWALLRIVLGGKRVPPQGNSLGNQNGTKIDPNAGLKIESEKVASWSGLGAILDRFGSRLGLESVRFF